MITVTPKLLTEEEVMERLIPLARRYHIPDGCYDHSAADRMSDFDALKWASLFDLLKAAKANRLQDACDDFCIPMSLRSIYGTQGASQPEELENTCGLTELAA
jgi:hypothetical protein